MSILGIVAEYDPFHRGHERHLRLAREAVKPTETLIILSSFFKQRGTPALLSPYSRARCALSAGADAVFALPAVWTIRDAEHYALGAVSTLSALGCTHIAFGAESRELSVLKAAADLLEEPGPVFQSALQAALSQGMGYPRAMEQAFLEVCIAGATDASHPLPAPEHARALLSRPNNTLALCYLRALRRLRCPMEPVLIPREGDYRDSEIHPDAPSASAVREALRRGDWTHALSALPEESCRTVREDFLSGRIPDLRVLDSILLSRLRAMSPEEASRLPDLSEGLENRLLREARVAGSRKELLERVSSRRYPAARVSRLCTWVLLDYVSSPCSAFSSYFAREPRLPEEALLLGLRRRPEMTARWKGLSLRILSGLQESRVPGLWEADLRARRLWYQCAGIPDPSRDVGGAGRIVSL